MNNEQLANTYEHKLLILKEKEILKNIYNKRLNKIEELTEKIDDNNLEFITISTGRKNNSNKKDDAVTFLNKVKNGKVTIEEAKESQKNFDHYLKMILKGNKTQEQEKTLANLYMLFNGRNHVINFIEDYGSMVLEAKRKAAEEPTEQGGTGPKILTPKLILQRLPIALAPVKPGNNSESLLNEIRKTVNSLYQSKETTKRVHNNVIKSIQL